MLRSKFRSWIAGRLAVAVLFVAVALCAASSTTADAQSHSGLRHRVERTHLEQLSDKGLSLLVPYSEAVAAAKRAEFRARSAERAASELLDQARDDLVVAHEDLDSARERTRAARLTDDPEAVAEARAQEGLERESLRLVEKRIRWLEAELESARAAVVVAERTVWLRQTELELARAKRLRKEGARAGARYRLTSFEDQMKRFRRAVEKAERSAARQSGRSAKLESSYRHELASLRAGGAEAPGG